MFNGLFDSLLGTAPTVDTHYLWCDKWYLLVQKHPTYPGVFYAIEVSDEKDRAVFGKPVVMVPHTPTLTKIKEEKREDARRSRQETFLAAARSSTEDVKVTWGSVKAWDLLWPSDKAPRDTPCGQAHCTARWLAGRETKPWTAVVPQDADLLGSLCADHRKMVEEYLAKNPDAWPPKLSEAPLPGSEP